MCNWQATVQICSQLSQFLVCTLEVSASHIFLRRVLFISASRLHFHVFFVCGDPSCYQISIWSQNNMGFWFRQKGDNYWVKEVYVTCDVMPVCFDAISGYCWDDGMLGSGGNLSDEFLLEMLKFEWAIIGWFETATIGTNASFLTLSMLTFIEYPVVKMPLCQ